MSRKIYNEIILQWNEENNNYDTLYEDSYDYDGPLHLVQGMDEDDIDFDGIEGEFAETWDTVSKNLSKKLVTEFKKTSKNTATQFDKDFARVAGKLTVYLKASVKAGNMGESIAREMGEAIEGVMSGRPYDDNGQKRVYWGVRVQRWHYCGKKSENSGESQTVQAQVEDIFGA